MNEPSKQTYLIGGGESSFVGGDAVNELVALRLPWRRFAGGSVKLVVEQREGLLARKGSAGEERAIAHRKLDLDVDAVGLASLDERCPKPVVDIVVGHVADHVRAPVDALFEIGETLFHPLHTKNKKKNKNRNTLIMQPAAPAGKK